MNKYEEKIIDFFLVFPLDISTTIEVKKHREPLRPNFPSNFV